jgi:hypothetical protein
MKKNIVIELLLVVFLSACASAVNILPAAVDKQPTIDAQRAMEMTRDGYAMETVIALEQTTNTPTPEQIPNLPKQWTDLSTITATPTATPDTAMALGLKQKTPILLGPGYNYRMACYIDEGNQLIITGRDIYSAWFRVAFGEGQTCFLLDENSMRTDLVPETSMQFWVFGSTIKISGDLSEVAIITP